MSDQLDIFSWSPEPVLPADHAAVYRIVEKHRGRAAGILQAQLADMTGLNSRVVRQIIKDLIEQYGKSIGSGSTGFFIPVTIEEANHIYNDWVSRGLSILERAYAFRRSDGLSSIVGQLRLQLPPESTV